MVGTLIKTHSPTGFYIGIVKDYIIDYDDEVISIGVTWNDNDDTTETFREYDDYDSCIYHFYDNGRWWRVDQNYYKFKRVLEGKCK